MKKILIVDDDKFILGFMKFSLANAGYDVISLGEGTQVIQTIKQEKPDLLILDVLIPGIDGFKLAEKIKADADTSYVKIIISSAIYKKDIYIAAAKKLGVDGYMIKPINKNQLIELVNSILGNA